MISWMKGLFTKKAEVKRVYKKQRRSRKRLNKPEVLAISKDIISNKKRKHIMQVYNISTYTYNLIKNGKHPRQLEK